MVHFRVLLSVFAVLMLSGNIFAAEEYASMSVSPGEIVWHPLIDNGGATLSVSGPKGLAIRQEYGAGSSPVVGIADSSGVGLPDGQYSYEMVFTPASGTVMRHDNEAVAAPAAEPMVQSGSFRVAAGRFVVPSGTESAGITAQAIPDGGIVALDQVIPDDLIVQSSLCVGFDCVDGESFGFDTIRLKENNLRIKFEDTSVGTFPANDWTIVANDSASGGASYLAFEDTTGAKIPFKVTAGAPTNSLFISSTGNAGFGTSTPVLDLHVTTTDTPALRFEQTSGGGFTAQTWDVAGNEANFFVRDVTGGSRLPFRIRPGAPTSSIDIGASGNVGIGTNNPGSKLHVVGLAPILTVESTGNGGAGILLNDSNSTGPITGTATGTWQITNRNSDGRLGFSRNSGADSVVVTSTGNVGIGTTTPTNKLEVCGTSGCAYNEGGTTWVNASSREYKDNIATLSAESALETLNGLNPVTFSYKGRPEQNRVGFIAEDVPDLVATRDRKGLSPLDIVAVLTRVVREQNRTIDELKGELAAIKNMLGGSNGQSISGADSSH